jgi:hypothetical protein
VDIEESDCLCLEKEETRKGGGGGQHDFIGEMFYCLCSLIRKASRAHPPRALFPLYGFNSSSAYKSNIIGAGEAYFSYRRIAEARAFRSFHLRTTPAKSAMSFRVSAVSPRGALPK